MIKNQIAFLLLIMSLINCNTSKLTLTETVSTETVSDTIRKYQTKKVEPKITINGRFDESQWKEVGWSTNFTKKGEPVASEYDTKFKIVYDEKYLYVAFECLDKHPDSIPLYPSPRDNPSNDWVEIDFDANNDKTTSYAFVVSPYGIRTDMFISGDDDNFDDSWHPKWSVKTIVTDSGWNAEMKIPFDQMEISSEIEHWGMQITRRLTRRNEYTNWQAMPKGTKGWVSQFGQLTGVKTENGKSQVEENYQYDKKIGVSELKKDIKLLKSTFENIYPDLYWFSSKRKMDSLFNDISNSIDQPLSEFEFYLKLTSIMNLIGDGHSWVRPSRNHINYVYDNYKLLPLGVKIVDHSIFITKSFCQNNELVKGMQIMEINGVPAKELVGKAINFISADGYNQTWKIDRVSNNFSYYLSLIIGSQDIFSIKVTESQTNDLKHISINGLLEKDWKSNAFPVSSTEYRNGNWNYHLFNDSTGYLSINTFARGSRFRNYVDEIFKKINNDRLHHLIIDVRDNYGGNDINGKHLFSYLAKTPFYYYKEYEVSSMLNEEIIENIDCCVSTEELDFLKVVSSIREDGKRIIYDFAKTGYDDPTKIVNPQNNAFEKKVYLLINGGSFSVTSDFASIFHTTNRGVIIGEESGGGYYGNTSGINKLLILPNSKIRVNINMIKHINNRKYNKDLFGRGVIPDYEIKPNGLDIFKNIDSELEYTLDLIQKSEN